MGNCGLHSETQSHQTYIMFHGTTLQKAYKIRREGFKRSARGMLGPGVYVSRSYRKARAYPKRLPPGETRAVLSLRVSVGRVKRIDSQDHPLKKSWHQEGYDTAWVPPNCGMVKSGLEETCVWDPNRITVLEVLELETRPMRSTDEDGYSSEDSSY